MRKLRFGESKQQATNTAVMEWDKDEKADCSDPKVSSNENMLWREGVLESHQHCKPLPVGRRMKAYNNPS